MSTSAARVSVICTFFEDVERVDDAVARLAPMASQGAQLILVDDASGDGTVDALRIHTSTMEGVKILARGSNGGVAAARTDALSYADREFVWFCDSDDTWEDTVLDALLSGVVSNETDIVVAGADIIEYRSQKQRRVDHVSHTVELSSDGARRAILSGELHGYLWNKLFRTASVRHVEFAPIRSQSDFSFTYRAVGLARQVSWIPTVVYTHVLRAGSVSQSSAGVADNLRRCYEIVARDMERHVAEDPNLLDRFRLAFYVIPATRALVRSGASHRATVTSIREVTSSMSLASIGRLAAVAPREAAQGLLIKLFPGLVARIYHFRLNRSREATRARG